MLKQNKKLNFKRNSVIKSKKSYILKVNSSKKYKNFLRIRKSFKFKYHIGNPIFRKIATTNLSKKFSKHVNIKIKPNNVFCTLRDSLKKSTLYITSAGKCNVKTSKKTLRFSSKIIIQSFFDNIKKHLKSTKFLINIIGPKKIRKAILEQLAINFKNKDLIINVKGKKCFNGCRPPKKRRKKQKGLRIFK
jgi:ribosomal protein S11